MSFKDNDLKQFDIGKTADSDFSLLEAKWKKYDNKHDIRLDNRPASQGGPQLHIKNIRQGIEWAYRANGSRSERSRFTAPSTNDVADIVRKYFNLGSDIIIESQFIGFSKDNKQLLIEIYRS